MAGGYGYESRRAARQRKKAAFAALREQVSPLVQQGDQISIERARQITQRYARENSDKPEPPAFMRKIGEMARAGLEQRMNTQNTALADAPPEIAAAADREAAGIRGVPRGVAEAFPEEAVDRKVYDAPDPLGQKFAKTGAGGFLKEIGAMVLNAGRPGVGAVNAALQGDNPIGGAFREMGDVYDANGQPLPKYTALDNPGINRLPDKGLEVGPVNITPKTLAGFGLETAADWTSYVDLPIGQAATGIAGKLFQRGGADAAQQVAKPSFLESIGRKVAPAIAGADDAAKLDPMNPSSATQRLFNIREPQQVLTRTDRALNALKTTLGAGTLEDEVATPIMRERRRVLRNVESQANRLGEVAGQVETAFERDAKGRITSLPGQPTIQDLAARLPQYRQYLTPEQVSAMQALQRETMPYGDALAELGIDVRSRADVIEGGFYLPRGRAAEEGADAPVKVRSGRGMAGGRKGFEKGATFESMTEGLDVGYEYADFRDAMQSYGRDAGTRAIDQWTASAFKATGLGETAADRINPGLRSQVETLRAKIAERRLTLIRQGSRERPLTQAATDAERVAARGGDLAENAAQRLEARVLAGESTEEVLAAARRELSILDRELNKQTGYASRAARRAQRNQARRAGTGAEFDALRDQLSGIEGDWKRAKEQAAQTPRDQGSIGLAGLNGTSFPDEIANAANKYLQDESGISGKGSLPIKAVNATNGLLRGLRASADVSFMGIQGLLGAVTHPLEYKTALGTAFKAMKDPRALGAYITHFDEAARSANLPDSRAWAAGGLRIGGSDTEFEIGRGLGPKVGAAIRNTPVIKQSNRAFGFFGDSMRLEAADAMARAMKASKKQLTPDDLSEIAKAANLLTGTTDKTLGGATGELFMFAPRFFASQLELVGRAVTLDPSPAGDEARTALIRLIGVGSLITIGMNEARGKETDFNPRSSNFMRIRDLGGQDISVFGPWDSLVKGIGATAEGDFTYIPRTKASPTVALVWDLLSGKTFTGEDSRTPEYLMRSLLPFSISDIGRESPMSTAINSAGVKSSELSPREQLDKAAQDKYSRGWSNLTLEERGALASERPDLAKKLTDARQGKYGEYEDAKKRTNTQVSALNEQLLNGSLTREEWRDQVDEVNTRLQGARDQIFGQDQDPPTAEEQSRDPAMRYLAIRMEFRDKNTGLVNEAAAENAVRDRMTSTEIEAAFRGFGADDQPLQKLRSKAAREYYAIPRYRGFTAEQGQAIDRAWDQVLAIAGNTDNRLKKLQALRKIEVSDPKVKQALYRRVYGTGLTQDKRREQWASRHPEARPLLGLGRGVVTEQEQQALSSALGST